MPVNDPLLLDFPTEIETERLVIRAPRLEDAPAMYRAVVASLPELRPWMDWAQPEPTPTAYESVIRRWVAHFTLREDLPLLLWHRETDELIGSSGLTSINWSVPRMEIGYWLHSQHTGQGYMTEAVNAITAFAFTHLHVERLEIRCDARNRASAAVAERAGYTLEGHFRKHSRTPDGTLRDTLIFARLRE